MDHSDFPVPADIGIVIPPHLRQDRFCDGFRHALTGGQLNRLEHLRLSFREGYRAARLYLRELRRRQGILAFPLAGRIRFRSRFH